MTGENKMKSSRQNQKQDGEFHSKKIKHDPQAESSRAKFGLNATSDGERKGNG
ncbi:MAG: CPC_1213 family protein [Oscillospiraceae bacterium]|nr:CPC_1213 family protein [Oscillospiraceae bacterium]